MVQNEKYEREKGNHQGHNDHFAVRSNHINLLPADLRNQEVNVGSGRPRQSGGLVQVPVPSREGTVAENLPDSKDDGDKSKMERPGAG